MLGTRAGEVWQLLGVPGNNVLVWDTRSILVTLLLGACTAACRDSAKAEQHAVNEAAQSGCDLGRPNPCSSDCEHGDNAACEKLIAMYLNGNGVERSREKAAMSYKRWCEAGRRYFCPPYAFVLLLGDGVPQDKPRARQMFKENCQHDPKGCGEFGSLLAIGYGVPQDLALGVYLLEVGCTYDDDASCLDLRKLASRGLYHQ